MKFKRVWFWAHVRRRFYDLHVTATAPLATEAVRRIANLYEVERDIAGLPAAERANLRQARARPLLDGLHAWVTATLARVPGRGNLASAIRYALNCRTALNRYQGDGCLAIGNNAAERATRPITLGRKNWLFCGSDPGGTRAAAIMSLLESAKLNAIDPNLPPPRAHIYRRPSHVPHHRTAAWAVAGLPSRLHQN